MIESIHRPSRIIVDLDAISYNLAQEVARLDKDQHLFAVVKANAYGHGAIEVAKLAESSNIVDGLCVSNLDEAIELRDAGICLPILVLSYVNPNFIPLANEYNIMLTAPSLSWLEEASDVLSKAKTNKPCVIHLKIDSGMGRIGLREETEWLKAKSLLTTQPYFELNGLFTHFATADSQDESYVLLQQSRFDKALQVFSDMNIPYIHTSNSATALWHGAWKSNLIRFGDAMYGLNPSGKELELPYELKPALSLESKIIHVKKVKKGEKIGYGATYEARGDEWIATLPIGYADGLLRRFQGYEVIVDGQLAEIVGRVCMDQCMIRLPHKLPIGTPVTIFGENQKRNNSIEDAAEYVGTINYEIICGLSDRLPRIYRQVEGN